MKIRVFITDGDQLQLQNVCDQFQCHMEFGGSTDCHGTLSGFERPQGSWLNGVNWVVAYLHVERWWQALGIRSHFLHSLSST